MLVEFLSIIHWISSISSHDWNVFWIWILLMTIQHYVINFVYVTNDHRYFPLVVSTCRSFSRSWLITRVTRQVSLVEQELPTLREHLSSLPKKHKWWYALSTQVVVNPTTIWSRPWRPPHNNNWFTNDNTDNILMIMAVILWYGIHAYDQLSCEIDCCLYHT
jgi:hypothetical protein